MGNCWQAFTFELEDGYVVGAAEPRRARPNGRCTWGRSFAVSYRAVARGRRRGTRDEGNGLGHMDHRREDLVLARRHVSEAVERLVGQRARVFELCVLRPPGNEGERLLKVMEETFKLMLHHERALEAEVEGSMEGLGPHLSRVAEQLELVLRTLSLWSRNPTACG